MALSFPEGFVWGTATAAHQIEGGNWNNDWWMWEHAPGGICREPSGDACDSWNRYPEDLDLVAGLGLKAYRFSLEWSRIEPEEGEWSRAALDHYRRMCAACHERGLEPIVTFHHFTTPRWLCHRGGWEEPSAADLFARYCARAAGHLGDLIGRACTINEPNIVAFMGYQAGIFPPGRQDRSLRRAVDDIFVDAHRKGVEAIRSGPGQAPVGLTLAMTDYQAVEGGEERARRLHAAMHDVYLDGTEGDDFLGVQTYTRNRVGPEGLLGPEPGVETTQMGYEFWPDALEATIRYAHRRAPGPRIMVTENGIGTDDDTRRIEYVTRALEGVGRCLEDGIPVDGYVYWSLLDNFEWVLGYMPTFGMVAVERADFTRTPKPSAAWLGRIARENRLPVESGA